ncbi:MAG: YigZ family protein [Calditrichaeota bacterium]|nr:MAG: YigZ family protein [Calditrichota bacterium]
MSESPDYFTVSQNLSLEHRVKDSLFIAHLSSAPNRQTAEKFINKIRVEFSDANHNCFAYRIGKEDRCDYRFDDDGEPGGSSGRPILQAMESRKLSDAVIVVTRYFGGTKLGVGGLIRAYGGAAFICIDAADLQPVIPKVILKIQFDYDFTGAIHNLISQFDGVIKTTDYSDFINLEVEIMKDRRASIVQKLTDATRGKIRIQ